MTTSIEDVRRDKVKKSELSNEEQIFQCVFMDVYALCLLCLCCSMCVDVVCV